MWGWIAPLIEGLAAAFKKLSGVKGIVTCGRAG
jgi:hypothetical protein